MRKVQTQPHMMLGSAHLRGKQQIMIMENAKKGSLEEPAPEVEINSLHTGNEGSTVMHFLRGGLQVTQISMIY